MSTGRRPHVAVIGGGFTGTMAAVHLERVGCSVSLIEARERAGEGAAFSTRDPAHLLNVRAGSMGAFADSPAEFADWLGERHGLVADDYAPRRLYREYLTGAVAGARFDRIHARALSIRRNGGLVVQTDGAGELHADAAMLAVGNLPPREPPLRREFEAAGIPYLANPWSEGASEALDALARSEGDLLLIGTGLTGVDMCLSLIGRGFGGRLVAYSRRGLLPLAHEPGPGSSFAFDPPRGLVPLMRALREAAAEHGWRVAIDSLRPHSIALWRGFSAAERRRFIRHARPWWDIHRHRIAPEPAARIAELLGQGRLIVVGGRVADVRRSGALAEMKIARRGGGEAVLEVAGAINCTGPARDIEAADDALSAQLLASGLARPHPLGLGFDVDEQCRLIAADGTAQRDLYALGPLTRGAFWEMVAVPEIRRQVEDAAKVLADSLAKSAPAG